ncbi:MAG TPA: efflux RND transporter periplasmic adaptor subunit [Caldimonas sp.]|nr:efflux RND transporter periplasmic adaptor subunit [Caldimonas sp.]
MSVVRNFRSFGNLGSTRRARPGATRIRRCAALAATVLLAVASYWCLPACSAELKADGTGPGLATVLVRSGAAGELAAFDGTVQAVRQTVVAAQVAGAVVELAVKAGDTVKAGQVLSRLDARAAEQTAAVGDAQVRSARAMQEAADREFERQKELFAQNYISRAALDRAEAQHKSAQAAVAAELASAGASRTTSGFYVVRAPYAGVVADVAVVLGDMAMPGRPLMTLYDPAALRVSVNVPQSAAARLDASTAVRLEVPGLRGESQPVRPASLQVLPTADPATHTLEVRFDLPPGLAGAKPGLFARVWLPAPGAGEGRLYVPKSALVRRAELDGLYVVGSDGKPLLRQVRVGRDAGPDVEVLAGVSAGERVALDPQAAARIR